MSNPRYSPLPGSYSPPPRRRGFIRGVLGWISGLIRYILATILVFALIAWGCFTLVSKLIRGDELNAPDLRGKPLSEAMQWLGEDKELRKYNLTLKWEREQSSEAVESGNIISQWPEAGDKIKKGSTIRVVVSGGIALISLPDLRNVNQYKAQVQLKKLGLEVGNRTLLASKEPVGTVLATDPPAGTGVPQGSRINIMVATGQTAVTQAMPDLKGLKLDQAREVLTKAGLFATEIKVTRSNAPAGQVIDQKPAAGEAVSDSTQIEIRYTPTREEGGYEPPAMPAAAGSAGGNAEIPEVILPEIEETPTPPPAGDERAPETGEGIRPSDLEGVPPREAPRDGDGPATPPTAGEAPGETDLEGAPQPPDQEPPAAPDPPPSEEHLEEFNTN